MIKTEEFNVVNSDKKVNSIDDIINKYILYKQKTCKDFKLNDIKYNVVALDTQENTLHSALMVYSFSDCNEENSKSLLAIELLKNKKVCLLSVAISSDRDSYNSMNSGFIYDYLRQDEYDLLKEMFGGTYRWDNNWL